jgi:hypothetical protein
MRSRGFTREAIEAALLEENRLRCDPPLPNAEVTGIARSISRYPPGDREFHSAPYKGIVQTETKLLFRTAAEFAKEVSKKVPWIAQPWVVAGSITQITGKIKAAGKTSWITR